MPLCTEQHTATNVVERGTLFFFFKKKQTTSKQTKQKPKTNQQLCLPSLTAGRHFGVSCYRPPSPRGPCSWTSKQAVWLVQNRLTQWADVPNPVEDPFCRHHTALHHTGSGGRETSPYPVKTALSTEKVPASPPRVLEVLLAVSLLPWQAETDINRVQLCFAFPGMLRLVSWHGFLVQALELWCFFSLNWG